ncbi:MAG: 3-hydroxyacyl-CoA dehydrogenase NAD-binding domain-containing protein [Myxococcota bacterium]|nr:3-hydroxyacyl-CoA dehydrogenase NAD-binding domain-containing protein [Myxococcota bacterium]
MTEAVTLEIQDNLGLICINYPPVNALGHAVRTGLVKALEEVEQNGNLEAVIMYGAGSTFIAGADITEFGKKLEPPHIMDINQALENCSKLVIAAIHGTALGGGLEVALSCHYRYAVASAKIGLPEVKLGLLPGAGGTQRLPRLIGAEAALELMVSGRFMSANQALELGAIDAVGGSELLEGAKTYAQELIAQGAEPKRVRDLPFEASAELFEGFRKSIARKARGFLAPWKIIDCVEAAANMDFDAGLKREGELFLELYKSPETKAQQHVFFAERQVGKIPDVPKDTPKQSVKEVAVIGAGTMGGGIAMCFANAGFEVTLVDANDEGLERGLGIINKNYASRVKRGRMSQEAMDGVMAKITGTTDFDAVGSADLVIEAVFEEMELKKDIFTKLDAIAKPGAILATNTSTLDVDAIAAVTKRPEHVIGMHFFSPANIMRLLEVVRGQKSSPSTIATAMNVGRKVGKVSVLVGNCFGFVGNRMLYGYTRQAGFLIEEGATVEQVDKVVKDFGMPMGPFTMGDLAGLDVGWRVRSARGNKEADGSRYGSTVSDRLCEQGRYGQKTQAGFYDYEEGNRTPKPSPMVAELVKTVASELGIEQREVSDEEVLERCMYPLVNIGAQLLDEGIALRPGDIDTIYLNGYGFPAYRGGPMFWADQVGLKKVYEAMCKYQEVHGDIWKPAPLIEKLAQEDSTFAAWAKSR